MMEASQTSPSATTSIDHEQGAASRRGQPGQAGIVDQISFAVMRRLSIIDAFTNDRHFREAGFNPLF